MRALLIGNYGVGNLGDEALREYFLRTFPEVEWEVVSAHPRAGERHRLPNGVRSALTTPWWRTLRAFRGADAVVFGGGSLFTDVESVRACLLWGMHAAAAAFFRKPVYFAFQGVGPFSTALGGRIARWAFRRAAFVTVRDEASAARLAAWGVASLLSFDPIAGLAPPSRCPGCPRDSLVFLPRFNSTHAFFAACEEARVAYPGAPTEVWLFEPQNEEERRIGGTLAERYGALVRPCADVGDTLARLAHVRQMVTQRFHGGLFALAAGCPVTVVPQREGDKLAELRDLLAAHGAREALLARVRDGEQALGAALREAA